MAEEGFEQACTSRRLTLRRLCKDYARDQARIKDARTSINRLLACQVGTLEVAAPVLVSKSKTCVSVESLDDDAEVLEVCVRAYVRVCAYVRACVRLRVVRCVCV